MTDPILQDIKWLREKARWNDLKLNEDDISRFVERVSIKLIDGGYEFRRTPVEEAQMDAFNEIFGKW